ncbi:MAG TPA: hypothetical protein VMV86_01830, partial [Methanosarcinales archaeon]|nr:hypothetical protein [Methanosarcinales archaeon]
MANIASKYIVYSVRDNNTPTIDDFLGAEGSIGLGLNLREFLQYTDENDNSNIDSILSEYSNILYSKDYIDGLKSKANIKDQKLFDANSSELLALKIEFGTKLSLPIAKIDNDLIKADRISPINYQTQNAMLASKLYDLHKDKKYERADKFINSSLGSVKSIFPNVTVWIWSKALSSKYSNSDKLSYDDNIINVTPFIKDLSISTSADGGTFSFALPPITTDLGKNKNGDFVWKLRDGSVKSDGSKYVSNNSLFYKDENGNNKRNRFYFDKVIQENDVVFIRFETLEGDKETILETQRLFNVPKELLKNSIFDMIGLVDSNPIVTNPEST